MALGDSPTRTIEGHFLVVGAHRIHRQLCTRTQTQAMVPIRTQESLLPGTGDVQQLAPRVYSSRSALVTPRYCTVGRSGSGSDFAAVASFRGHYHTGGASITQFGRTRNYYFNTHTHTPLKTIAKTKITHSPTPGSSNLTDCRAILQIRNNNREFHSRDAQYKHARNCANAHTHTIPILHARAPFRLLRTQMCVCSSNSETCLALSH